LGGWGTVSRSFMGVVGCFCW